MPMHVDHQVNSSTSARAAPLTLDGQPVAARVAREGAPASRARRRPRRRASTSGADAGRAINVIGAKQTPATPHAPIFSAASRRRPCARAPCRKVVLDVRGRNRRQWLASGDNRCRRTRRRCRLYSTARRYHEAAAALQGRGEAGAFVAVVDGHPRRTHLLGPRRARRRRERRRGSAAGRRDELHLTRCFVLGQIERSARSRLSESAA